MGGFVGNKTTEPSILAVTFVFPGVVSTESLVQDIITIFVRIQVNINSILFIFLDLKIRHSLGCSIVKSNHCQSRIPLKRNGSFDFLGSEVR